MASKDDVQHRDGPVRTPREVDGWSYHAVNLGQPETEVRSLHLDRPIKSSQRLELIQSLRINPGFHFGGFDLPERILTPRQPYQSSPLSYLNGIGRSWSLFAETDSLEWAEFSTVGMRGGSMELWFRNVVKGSTAIVTVTANTGILPGHATGSVNISSNATASNSTILVSGTNNNVIDIVVHPTDPFAVLVGLGLGPGVDFFSFKSATYRTI